MVAFIGFFVWLNLGDPCDDFKHRYGSNPD